MMESMRNTANTLELQLNGEDTYETHMSQDAWGRFQDGEPFVVSFMPDSDTVTRSIQMCRGNTMVCHGDGVFVLPDQIEGYTVQYQRKCQKFQIIKS
jgi:hypothetical protein